MSSLHLVAHTVSTTPRARYNRWEDSIGEEGPRDDSIVGKRFTKGGQKASNDDTNTRCFVHMDREDYADIKTCNETAYCNPAEVDGPRQYRNVGTGTRGAMSEQDMWQQAVHRNPNPNTAEAAAHVPCTISLCPFFLSYPLFFVSCFFLFSAILTESAPSPLPVTPRPLSGSHGSRAAG